ncbi:enoyl-CoA hydratase-related protein [Pseudomonas sp. GL-B-16]|uniref:enoyl-CoA hydratase-related protein n=1 Tax=Pseudomonas sp. GL-B-16 TaxID=2832373 RepID=UPI001CBE9B9C
MTEGRRDAQTVVAAVRGYALGVGCERAMPCDIVVTGENALYSMNANLLQRIWREDSILDLPGFGSAQVRKDILTMAEQNWRQMPHMHHWRPTP